MNKEQIISLAKDYYQKYFKENKFQNEEKTDDMVLNSDNLKNKVKKMKEEEINKLESLDILQHQIEEKAKKSFQKVFHEKENTKSVYHKMTTEEIYKKMKQQQCQLLEKVAMMKEKQLHLK